MLKNEMDAEDVLQNSFVTVFRKLESFRYDSTIGAWIKRIMINNCINFLKKKRLRFEELTDKVNHKMVVSEYDDENRRRLKTTDVNRALMCLPDGYRVVFSLYLLEGYDHKEIASILEISEATSKSQYSRAKKKMKEILTSPQFEAS
jgi:RNA polymerase sigma-70 factor (ECF subfamily)